MPNRILAPYQSDFYAELDSLADVTNGAFLNDATVTVTIFDKGGNAITGANNVPAPYVASSNGIYRATIPHTANLQLNTLYDVDVFVTRGGLNLHIWLEILVVHLPSSIVPQVPSQAVSPSGPPLFG